MGEMGLTQDVGEEGVKFEVWVRHAARTRDCITLQAKDRDGKAAWTHDVAHLLWTHAINNTGTGADPHVPDRTEENRTEEKRNWGNCNVPAAYK